MFGTCIKYFVDLIDMHCYIFFSKLLFSHVLLLLVQVPLIVFLSYGLNVDHSVPFTKLERLERKRKTKKRSVRIIEADTLRQNKTYGKV